MFRAKPAAIWYESFILLGSFPSGSYGKKNLPAMQETWIQSLGQEEPLEKGLATHSSILFIFNLFIIGHGGSSLICGFL